MKPDLQAHALANESALKKSFIFYVQTRIAFVSENLGEFFRLLSEELFLSQGSSYRPINTLMFRHLELIFGVD